MKKIIAFIFLLSWIIIEYGAIAQQGIPLYNDSIPNIIGIVPQEDPPTITAYFPDKQKVTGKMYLSSI